MKLRLRRPNPKGGKIIMVKNIVRRRLCVAMIIFLTSGCVPLAVGTLAVGTGTGTYFYINGVLETDYKSTYDQVWTACEKTMADARAVNVQPLKEIGKGKIFAIINDEKVQIDVLYKGKNLTTVTIRVGFLGDKTASRLLHDKIEYNLPKTSGGA